jgi:hypothetical protein
MKTNQKQNIYHGSPSWESSTIGRDLILDFLLPNGNSVASKTAYKLEFYAKTSCTVSINGSNPIFLDDKEELELFDIWSLKLLSDGSAFRYIAYL